jgi:hypothetical protein
MAEDDRLFNADRVAEGTKIVGAELEAPIGRVVSGRPAMVAEVEIDELELVEQPAEMRLEVGVVVAARSAVDEDDRRPLAHMVAVRHERGPVDVEPQPSPVHLDLQRRTFASVAGRRGPRSGFASDEAEMSECHIGRR